MKVTVRLAKESDFSAYLALMQQTYQASFVNEELGLTKECFSKEIFHAPNSQQFFKNMMEVTNQQKCWLAFLGEKLVGSITMSEEISEYHLGGFYVARDYQGLGIGKRLWNFALEYAQGKDITLGVYTHNTKAIELYKKWGFEVDSTKAIQVGSWSGWPEGVVIKTVFMRRHI